LDLCKYVIPLLDVLRVDDLTQAIYAPKLGDMEMGQIVGKEGFREAVEFALRSRDVSGVRLRSLSIKVAKWNVLGEDLGEPFEDKIKTLVDKLDYLE